MCPQVAEFMRLLVDVMRVGWDEAWDLTTKCGSQCIVWEPRVGASQNISEFTRCENVGNGAETKASTTPTIL